MGLKSQCGQAGCFWRLQGRNLRHKDGYGFALPGPQCPHLRVRMLEGHSAALIRPLTGMGRRRHWLSRLPWAGTWRGTEKCPQPGSATSTPLPRRRVAMLGGGELPGTSKEEPPTSPPENPWSACCRPCPVWVSITTPRPRPGHMGPCFCQGPFLQPGLSACILAASLSHLLVNRPVAPLTPPHTPES